MDAIYSAEQIEVPVALPSILKAYTKEVIRNNPEDIPAFSRESHNSKPYHHSASLCSPTPLTAHQSSPLPSLLPYLLSATSLPWPPAVRLHLPTSPLPLLESLCSASR